MATNRIIFIFLAVLGYCAYPSVAEIHAAVRMAASCSYSDVSSAVSSASIGDTVAVPSGVCTWERPLSITKGINLIGAGIGSTVITSEYSSSGGYLIKYQPANYSLNSPFRVSGFTFDLNYRCKGIQLGVANYDQPYITQTKVRIDHNRFLNPAGGTSGGSAQYIWHFTMYGVIDNNIFEDCYYPLKADPDADCTYWKYLTLNPGFPDDSMYIEDNKFNGIYGIVTDCQFSGRYAYRYNDITIKADIYPLFDMHGNQSNTIGMCSCFGGEIYGNQITGNYSVDLCDQRGGQALVFYNNQTTNRSVFYIQVREEYPDSGNPPVTDLDGDPQHVHKSYYWNNRKNLTGHLNAIVEGQHVGDIPLVNRDYFALDEGFNGTSGMGCGPLASRPSTCMVGVGYWATNQSCSDLTGLVGVTPSTPISGTLYRCTDTNKWTEIYKPYSYPHPLRSGINAPRNLRIVE